MPIVKKKNDEVSKSKKSSLLEILKNIKTKRTKFCMILSCSSSIIHLKYTGKLMIHNIH